MGSEDELLLVLINDVKNDANGEPLGFSFLVEVGVDGCGRGGAAVINTGTLDCGDELGGGSEYGNGGGITDTVVGAR